VICVSDLKTTKRPLLFSWKRCKIQRVQSTTIFWLVLIFAYSLSTAQMPRCIWTNNPFFGHADGQTTQA